MPDELEKYLTAIKENLQKQIYKLWKESGFKTKGNWEEIFGKSLETDEIFKAWYFAKYTNYVAKAGKKAYPLQMYVNAALINPGFKPGQYPGAGSLPHLIDIWKTSAPQIDFLSLDIYFRNLSEWCGKILRKYKHRSYNHWFFPVQISFNLEFN